MMKKLATFLDTKSGNTKANSSEFYRNSKYEEGFDFISLIQSWPDIAGAKLSEHTIPLKNTNGTLTVLSNHSAFASEMKFMELPLKKKIFQKFPNLEGKIKTIHFIVDSTHFNQQKEIFTKISKESKKEIELPHPFSPEGKKLKKEAEEFVSEIKDDELKKSFESLYIQSKFNANK